MVKTHEQNRIGIYIRTVLRGYNNNNKHTNIQYTIHRDRKTSTIPQKAGHGAQEDENGQYP